MYDFTINLMRTMVCNQLFSVPRYYIYLLLIFWGSTACSSDTSSLNFDSDIWKNDLSGCQGNRLGLKNQVEEIRLQLVGLNERTIRSLLGKPDAEELLEKSNKIYIYYLSSGPKCETPAQAGEIEALALRFDALGTVKESNLLTD